MAISRVTDRRFQIFISSTFRDLREERKQAVEVIFERGHIPIDLARFSAANDSDRKVIERAIGDCQIYLLMLGHRYGELVPNGDISYTELEYEIAQKKGLQTLVLLMDPGAVLGSVGRNILHGPHLFNIDASVFRRFNMMERLKMEFRAETYNLSNTPWLDRPDTTLGDAAFGQVTTAQGTQTVKVNMNRSFQASLRIVF